MTLRSTTTWIVVIDDDEATRDAMTDLLRDEGYRVEAFGSAEAAIAVLAHRPVPDLILLDYLIPGMGAERLVHELERLGVDAPILLVTAANRASISASLLHMVRLVKKPFGIGVFLDEVAAATDRGDGEPEGRDE